jgi:hypothetical protein
MSIHACSVQRVRGEMWFPTLEEVRAALTKAGGPCTQ